VTAAPARRPAREQKELVEAAISGPVPHLVRSVGADGRLREYRSLLSKGAAKEQEAVQAQKS